MNDIIHRALKRNNDCPDIAQLFDAMEQAPSDPRRQKAEDHIKSCPGCQTEWSLYQQFEAAEVPPQERADVDFVVQQVKAQRAAQRRLDRTGDVRSFWQKFWTPAWIGGTALAMAALVMTVGLVSQWRARHSSTTYDGENQTFRSQSVEITTALRGIPQVPKEIQWKPVQGAATYAVLLTEVDGNRIFYTNVTSTSLSVPDNVSKLLAQGKVLLLDVTASDASARQVARSGAVRIHVSSDGTSPR